jgi:two-component system response regulator VicR
MAEQIKILCIEDESEMIDLMRFILERKGFDFVGAQGGHRGLDAARQEKPDLILLDLMMPDIEGWEVYRQLKADDQLRDVPVIVVTAKAQLVDRVVGLHLAKVDDYITKPFDPKELLDSIYSALHIEARS